MGDHLKGGLEWIRSKASRQLSKKLLDAYIREIFPEGTLIAEDYDSGEVWEFDWAIDREDVKLSNATRVEMTYVAAKRKQSALKAAAVPPPPPAGAAKPPPAKPAAGAKPPPGKPAEEEGGDVEKVIEQLRKTIGLIDESIAALAGAQDMASLEAAIEQVRVAEGHLGLSWADQRSVGEDDEKLGEASRMLNDERSRLSTVINETRTTLRTDLVTAAQGGDQEAQRLYYALSAEEADAETQALTWLQSQIGVDDTSALEAVKAIIEEEATRLGGGEVAEKDPLAAKPKAVAGAPVPAAGVPVAQKSNTLEDVATVTGPAVYKNKAEQLLTTVVLVPGESDGEDGPLTPKKISDVAHEWMAEWRLMDYEHSVAMGGDEGLSAIPVESHITREDQTITALDGTVLELPAGTWEITSKVRDDLWPQVESGEIGGASIMGVSRADFAQLEASTKSAVEFGQEFQQIIQRVPLSKLGEDWFCPVVSLVKQGQVPKAKAIAMKSAMPEPWYKRWFGIGTAQSTQKSIDQHMSSEHTQKDNSEEEDELMAMTDEERKRFAIEVGGAAAEAMTMSLKNAGVIQVEEQTIETEEQRRKREIREEAQAMLQEAGLLDADGKPIGGAAEAAEQSKAATQESGGDQEEEEDDDENVGFEDLVDEDDGSGSISATERDELEILRNRDQAVRTLLSNADGEISEVGLKALFPSALDDEAPAPKKQRQAGRSRARDMDLVSGQAAVASTKGKKPNPTRDATGRRLNKPNAVQVA